MTFFQSLWQGAGISWHTLDLPRSNILSTPPLPILYSNSSPYSCTKSLQKECIREKVCNIHLCPLFEKHNTQQLAFYFFFIPQTFLQFQVCSFLPFLPLPPPLVQYPPPSWLFLNHPRFADIP